MIRAAICDDDREYGKRLAERLVKFSGGGIKTFLYSSGEDLLEDVELKHELVILDVEMPGLSGFETAAKVREANRDAVLVFISGVKNPTTECFKVAPYRYLLKQFDETKMEWELQEILREVGRVFADEALICVQDGVSIRVNLRDIVYLSIVRGGCAVHQPQGISGREAERQPILVRERIKDLAEKLSSKDFVLAHNSYLINLRFVERFSRTEVTLKTGEILAVARSKYGTFEEALFQYWGGKYQ